MGKKSTPKPPDLTPLSNAQLEISKQQLAQAQQQMNMSAEQFNRYMDLSNQELQQSQAQYDTQMGLQSRALDQADAANAISRQVADKQMSAMDQSMQYAQEDRSRYTNTILPLQDQYIKEAQAYSSPEKQAAAAAQALADNQTQIEAQRNNQMSQLASMGIDPSQVMSSSLSSQLGVAGAAQGALNANTARENTIQTGYNMLGNAINMGNNLPSQALGALGTGTQAGNSAAGNMQSGANVYANASQIGATASGIRQSSLGLSSQLTGSPMSWASLGNQSYGGASNGIMNASSIQNQMFQNQMSQQAMKNQQSQSTMSAIGGMAGMAAMFMAEGGVVDPEQLPPIIGSTGAPVIAQPNTDVTLSDAAPAIGDVNHVYAARPAMLSDRDRMGMSIAAGMLDRGANSPAYTDANMQTSWLRPQMRAEGGAMGRVMPSMAARDKILTFTTPGEYVVPADVVRQLGIQHFEKLVQKYHRPGA